MSRPDIVKDSNKLKRLIIEAKEQRGLSNIQIVNSINELGGPVFSTSALSRYFKQSKSGSLSQVQVLALAAFLGIRVKLDIGFFNDRKHQETIFKALIDTIKDNKK